MKKIALILLAAALAGCCSYKTTTEGNRTMCYIENSGWKLFCCIPIASGDPEYANLEVPIWFCDSVTLEVNMMLLDQAMTKYGYTSTKDLVSYRTEEVVIPFFFKRYTYHTSAEVLK